uniref:Amino acid adenylation domain-containing protein n=1 Tax=Candidatus Kentrum sp. FW TaxID=2126338 RepID=A0A450TZG2_9GAMM|nr:MAG: amino acid adenylation domain-containing protein [Candidatus Kentron sp. FW]
MAESPPTNVDVEPRLPPTQWNNTQQDYPRDRCVHELFEQQAARVPDAIALICEGQRLTYRELNERVNRLAHFLRKKGTEPDMSIGLCLERSPDLVVGLLGVLKSGAAYVPLDPSFPKERLTTMLADADARILVTDTRISTHLPPILEEGPWPHEGVAPTVVCVDSDHDEIARQSPDNPVPETTPEHLAYTIHTSGSTGKPKGVQIPHRALVNFLTSMARQPGLAGHDTLLAVTTISFDIAGLEIFLPLTTGARVVLADRAASASGPGLVELIRAAKPTIMQATPATWYLLLAAGWTGLPGLKIICGGEALPRALAHRLIETGAHLWNLYGPTETTIWSAVYEVGKGRQYTGGAGSDVSANAAESIPIPIGTPIANTTFHILDEEMRPVPVGEIGELHIGGDGLARGYRNRPDLTAERFVANPFDAGRLYKTGDLARYLSDGNVEFLGRMDHQVKVHGFRIELGEIEAVLDRHPGVHRSVVTVHGSGGDKKNDDPFEGKNKRLVAYVIPHRYSQSGRYRLEPEKGEEIFSGQQQVSQWGQLWDLAYAQESSRIDPTFNISGWNDSATGAPIPADDMREWVDTTVRRILSLKPDRVMEIGCGTGMLLFRVAPHCSHYCGTDIAPNALRHITEHKDHFTGDWSAIRLREGAADDLHEIAPGTFDTVIINSVIQMFPSIHYLVDVLEKAVKMVEPGGAIFVGDIRSLSLLTAFHTAIQWQRAPDTLSGEQFRRRVRKAMAMERQLVVDPVFFIALKQHLPAISHVEIQLRRGLAPNEMNRFRFDAILHIGKEVVPSRGTARRYDWREGQRNEAWVRGQLAEMQPETLVIERIPDARLGETMRLLSLLKDREGTTTMGKLRDILNATPDSPTGVEPDTWWRLADETWADETRMNGTGYSAYIGWSSEPGCYDVLFQKGSGLPTEFAKAHEPGSASIAWPSTWTDYANNPRQGQETDKLEPVLRHYLKQHLPDYMLPSAFVILNALPLTPNGKIDRKALPAPEKTRPQLATALAEPRSGIEQKIAGIWRQVLQLDAVGTLDNFFELGGNSLLLTGIHGRLEEAFDREISIVDLFGYPTIRDLASHLAETSAAEDLSTIKYDGKPIVSVKTEVDDALRPTVPGILPSARPTGTETKDIAIIGLSCRFPGAATPEQFWQNLRDGVESIRFFSDAELEEIDPALLNDPRYVKAGAMLPDIERFDAAFFGYSAREAEIMDPQQRLFLECAWEALERAGYNPKIFPGAIGVYAGSGMNTYLLNNIHPHGEFSSSTLLGSARDLRIRLANSADSLTTRACYKLGLTGPGMTIQTACSTSLVAIHTACQALRAGECHMALAGGVSITVPQRTGYRYQEDMILSPDGHCRAFDEKAQGTVFGSGCGIVVLKPLDRALADGDTIHTVIKGSNVNNDGTMKVGYTAPGVTGQAEVIRAALLDARIDPGTISYIEAHGTGTTLGDPVEITALTRAFREYTQDSGFCAIGSVKTNVGHLIEAAGVCGLIKTVLALKHKQLPPSLHFQRANPTIDFAASPFHVNTTLTDWETPALPRRAGVSSFGMGGTNAHMILEEAPEPPATTTPAPMERPLHILTLSARTEAVLDGLTRRYVDHLDAHPGIPAADLCFTANTGRRHFEHRLAVMAKSTAQCREALSDFLPASARPPSPTTVVRAQKPLIAFLFTGQGAQYVDMGRQLYDTSPTFQRTLDRCDETLRPLLDKPLLEILYPDDGAIGGELDETAYTQPALFALEYALAELWQSWGVKPDVVMGHNIGEYVAACVAGVFDLEDGLKLIAERGRLMQRLPKNGAMASVMASEAHVRDILSGIPTVIEGVSIAAINGSEAVVISGLAEAVDAARARFSDANIKTTKLTVSHAFHSVLMESMLDDFEVFAERFRFSPPRIRLISNVTGESATDEYTTPAYWRRHIREPVQFAAGMETIDRLGVGIFLEIGPRPVLLGMGRECLSADREDDRGLWLPSMPPETENWPQLLRTLAELYRQGVPIDWTGFDRDYPRRRVALPTYPFQRQRYWIDPPGQRGNGTIPPRGEIAEEAETSGSLEEALYQVAWRPDARPPPSPDMERVTGHWLVFSDNRGLGQGTAAHLRSKGAMCTMVFPGHEYRQIGERENERVFRLNATLPEHFQQLLPAIPNVQGVIHLWSLDAPEAPTDIDDLDRAIEIGCASALHLVRSLVERYLELPALWLVTRGAQSVMETDAVPGVAQSGLWGLGKVIGLEHPDLDCVLLDLDSAISPSEQAAKLFEEITNGKGTARQERQIAFRHGTRYVARLARYSPIAPPSTSMAFREDTSYLITGGLGGLGLQVAQWMVHRGARHLALVGRGGAGPAAKTSLKALEALGAKITVIRADIADTADVKRIFTEIDHALPPLAGIIHAAGVVEFGGILQQDWERFSRVMAPKARGGWLLHTLTKDLPLDFFVCFSSLASLLGSPGLGGYAAANAFLDTLAHHRHALGYTALTLDWGPWGEMGMSASLDAYHRNRLTEWGIGNIAPAEGISVLGRLLREPIARVGVMPMDWSRWLRQFPRRQAFYDEVVVPDAGTAPTTREKTASLIKELRDLPASARRERLMARILAEMEKTLGFGGITPDQNVMELGMDSLMAVEFRAWLKSELESPPRSTLLFDYPTTKSLADYLLQEALAFDDSKGTQGDFHSTLAPIQRQNDKTGGKTPLFCVAGVFGNVFDFYPLSRHLGPEQPLYGLRSLGLDEEVSPYTRMEDIAAHHIESLQAIRPQGPYAICGYSFGGKVALEIARQLLHQGQEVSLLVIIDIQVAIPDAEKRVSQWDSARSIVEFAGIYGGVLEKNLGISQEKLRSLEEPEQFSYLAKRLTKAGRLSTALEAKRQVAVCWANLRAVEEYALEKIPIPIRFLRAAELPAKSQPGYGFLPDEAATAADPSWGWNRVSDTVEVQVLPGNHFTMMTEPHVRAVAEWLKACLGSCAWKK